MLTKLQWATAIHNYFNKDTHAKYTCTEILQITNCNQCPYYNDAKCPFYLINDMIKESNKVLNVNALKDLKQ